ncbi:S8 family peptidase [Archangium sp.]|uniref:S8 family peptidase n=1 Tax=Archangium sp. TaxID=1872627 RepID=UPI002EDB3DBB
MRNMKGWLMTIGLTLAAGSTMAAQPEDVGASAPVVPGKVLRVKAEHRVAGEYIVVLKEKPHPALPEVAKRGEELARLHGMEILRTYEHAFRGFHIRTTEAQAEALAQHPWVEAVEENALAEVSGGIQTNPPWNLDRIDQGTRSLNNSYAYENATDVHVYVVDTGIMEGHSEFLGDDGWNSRVDTVYTAFGDGNADGMGGLGHGTFVAGIVGGKTYGVAKQVKIHSVKVMNNSGNMTTDSINAGLNWLVANAQTPSVVNLSVNSLSSAFSLNTATSNLANRAGIVVVSAAGNALVQQPGGTTEGADACTISPNSINTNGSNPKFIVVAATDKNDVRMNPNSPVTSPPNTAPIYSNFGSCVDIFAPGVDIKSSTKDGAVGIANGTSFAAPHVTGVAAILLSRGVPAENIKQQLLSATLQGLVTNPGPGSPNRLLYKRHPSTLLSLGAAKSVSGGAGSITTYMVNLSATKPTLTISISGGTGDADLYVRYGDLPEQHVYHCRPLRAGNNETCTFNNAVAGPWYVQLRGYSAYSTTLLAQ